MIEDAVQPTDTGVDRPMRGVTAVVAAHGIDLPGRPARPRAGAVGQCSVADPRRLPTPRGPGA